MYLYKRGAGAMRRVMHLARYNSRGEIIGAACGTRIGLDTSCNLPLGQPVCKSCKAQQRREIK